MLNWRKDDFTFRAITRARARLCTFDDDEAMMALKSAMAMAAGLMLAGCAADYTPTPLAANFPATLQPKLQAAYHWAVITDNIEKHVREELKKNPPRPIFINEPQQPTPF